MFYRFLAGWLFFFFVMPAQAQHTLELRASALLIQENWALDNSPDDLILDPTETTGLQGGLQWTFLKWLGLQCSARWQPNNLDLGPLHNPFQEVRHSASYGQQSDFMIFGGPVFHLSNRPQNILVSLSLGAGYRNQQIGPISERYVDLQDYRSKDLRYTFDPQGGWLANAGLEFKFNHSELPIGIMLGGNFQWSVIEQHVQRFSNGAGDAPELRSLEVLSYSAQVGLCYQLIQP